MRRSIALLSLLLLVTPGFADVSDVNDNGLVARYHTSETNSGTAVLVIGGSDGGYASQQVGDELAKAGYPALTLAYFQNWKGEPAGVPDALSRIPLEYVFNAIDWLKTRAGVQRVVLMGHSRGTELSLETAVHRSDIAGVVVFAPSSLRFGSTSGWRAAWTLNGKSLPYLGGVYQTPEDFKDVLDGKDRKRAEIEVEKFTPRCCWFPPPPTGLGPPLAWPTRLRHMQAVRWSTLNSTMPAIC